MREKSGILLQILFAYLNPLLVILKTEPDTLTIVNTAKLVCTKAFFFLRLLPYIYMRFNYNVVSHTKLNK